MKLLAVLSLGFIANALASPIANDAPTDLIERGTPTKHEASVTRQTISLCTQYAYYAANGYEILNNLWGKDAATSGSQCTYYEGATGSGASAGVKWSSDWTWTGAENNVKSYVYVGRQLPKGIKVSQAKTMLSEIQWRYNTTANVRANVAYDIFTAQDPNHVNSSGDYELMIWLGRFGGVWPITEKGAPIATVTIAGYTFDLYFGYNGSMKVYSFVRAGNNDITSFKADVKLFFNYLTKNYQYPETTQNLIVYQIGTEAFTGGPAKFSVPNFSAAYTT